MSRKCLLVAQEDGMGCGVACVASVLGKTYRSAMAMFPNPGLATVRGYPRKELCAVLRSAGAPYRKRGFGRRTGPAKAAVIPLRSIVCVRRWGGDRYLHYLVRCEDGWMDPWSKSHDSRTEDLSFERAPALLRKQLPKGWVLLSFIAPDEV